MQTLTKLRRVLERQPTGALTQGVREEVLALLAGCWDELEGGDAEAMAPWKLDRAEGLTWEPPVLSFEIERHGGTVMGSSRAERQSWGVNLDEGRAGCCTIGHRQLRPMQPRLNVKPLVEEIGRLIVATHEDERLMWREDGSVRVFVGKIIPDNSAVKQTRVGRRRRFREALHEWLTAKGWQEVGLYVYRKR
jgi:hypothetical protein